MKEKRGCSNSMYVNIISLYEIFTDDTYCCLLKCKLPYTILQNLKICEKYYFDVYKMCKKLRLQFLLSQFLPNHKISSFKNSIHRNLVIGLYVVETFSQYLI